MTPPTLEAGPALLRPLRLDDAEALFPAFSDPAVMRYWSAPPHQSPADTEADLAWWLQSNADAAFAIEDGAGRVAGRTGLYRIREGVREIGIILRPDFVGKGLARGAVEALCAYGFAHLEIHRIAADIDPDNTPSIRLFEACRFTLEGRLKLNWRTHIGLRDSLIYARCEGES
jgi:RimJ/RimL family protein N-acetyltransferase